MRIFTTDVRVRGHEIDSLGHVNNAVYLNWLEHARWELSETGALIADASTLAVVRRVELDYLHETRLGDTVRIVTWPRRVGNTSFVLGAHIEVVAAREPRRVGLKVLAATQVIVCLARSGGKVAVPAAWRQVFPAEDPGATLPEDAAVR